MNQLQEELLLSAAPLIERALAEDLGSGDATSLSTMPADAHLHGVITAKSAGVIAGLGVAAAVFRRVDPAVVFTALVADGEWVTPGERVAEIHGPAVALLSAERTALNFLQRMSGIATATRAYVDAVALSRAVILDTRKTLPGYRLLDKYAVRMGGGVNHRMGLFDMLLIKDNHVDGVGSETAAGSLTTAVSRARTAYPQLPLEVEVRSLDELREALAFTPPPDRILLDNMTPETMRQAVALTAGRVPLEASGNVSLTTVAEIAATGVDYISVGALTHSVKALDLSMTLSRPATVVASDLTQRLRAARAALGARLVILGHHYQRDEVIAWADYRGDSLELARAAAASEAEYLVFCGVHFMAETAAILAQPGQQVLSPDPEAGCYLADTATLPAVQAAWEMLAASVGTAAITPITYVNSSAALKAFCGDHGGSVCTSGNAEKVLHWALVQRPHVFFFPDQHLGRNTALRMGIQPEAILLWDPLRPPSAEQLHHARVILWPGACNVHQNFRPAHIAALRARDPEARVIVHPECPAEVVALADEVGSTATIIKQIDAAAPGTHWAVATESRLVRRLQLAHPEQTIVSLAEVAPICPTMSRVTLANLTGIVEALARGEVQHAVTVAPETARAARLALERMLRIV